MPQSPTEGWGRLEGDGILGVHNKSPAEWALEVTSPQSEWFWCHCCYAAAVSFIFLIENEIEKQRRRCHLYFLVSVTALWDFCLNNLGNRFSSLLCSSGVSKKRRGPPAGSLRAPHIPSSLTCQVYSPRQMRSLTTTTPLHDSCLRCSQTHPPCGCQSVGTHCLAASQCVMPVIWVHRSAA